MRPKNCLHKTLTFFVFLTFCFFFHFSWRADSTFRPLHCSLILSKLNYGFKVFSFASPSCLQIVYLIHHVGICLAMGAFKPCPVPSLLVDARVFPLDPHQQSLFPHYWYMSQVLSSILTYLTSACTALDHVCSFHHRTQTLLDQVALPQPVIAATLYKTVVPWELPAMHFCHSLLEYATKLNSIDFESQHEGCTPIFT